MNRLNLLFILVLSILTACASEQGSTNGNGQTHSSGNTSQSGSLARFTIVGNHLYAVNDSQLVAFDITDPQNISEVSKKRVHFGIETIFAYEGNLFIGGQQGLYIYEASEVPENPKFISQFSHARACDPVVVQGYYAYITLRNTGNCPGSSNVLKVLDVTDLYQPELIKDYPLKAPWGLAASEHKLFVCDENELKVFDSTDPLNLKTEHTIPLKGCMDIIHLNENLIVTSLAGITQYSVIDANIEKLSHIDVGR